MREDEREKEYKWGGEASWESIGGRVKEGEGEGGGGEWRKGSEGRNRGW